MAFSYDEEQIFSNFILHHMKNISLNLNYTCKNNDLGISYWTMIKENNRYTSLSNIYLNYIHYQIKFIQIDKRYNSKLANNSLNLQTTREGFIKNVVIISKSGVKTRKIKKINFKMI